MSESERLFWTVFWSFGAGMLVGFWVLLFTQLRKGKGKRHG